MAGTPRLTLLDHRVYSYIITGYDELEALNHQVEESFKLGNINWKAIIEPIVLTQDVLDRAEYYFRMSLKPTDPTPGLCFVVKGDIVFGDGDQEYWRIGDTNPRTLPDGVRYWRRLGDWRTPIENLPKVPRYEPGKVKIRWEIQTFGFEILLD